MTTIKAVVRDGRIEVDEPIDLPNGTVLEIAVPDGARPTDRDEPMSPAEIEEVLAAMDRMEPLRMTDAELAAWEADRKARRDWEKAHFFERAGKLQRMWE
jgi:hypothetical protein